MTDRKIIGHELRRARIRCLYSREEIAGRFGLRIKDIDDLEAGNSCALTLDQQIEVCHFFKLGPLKNLGSIGNE